ncbi:MAG: acetyltransferase [Ignavibacteriae bacterium]|nr:acetyltransferase [Ignavibacteriota bacterium]
MKKIIILGGSGIGMIAASIIEKNRIGEVIGFLNDFEKVGNKIGKFKKFPIIGKTEDLDNYLLDENTYFFIAYVGLKNEKETFNKINSLQIPQKKLISIIDKTSVIPNEFCKIGNGVLIAPLAQLSTDTIVSDNCILLPNSYLGHDSTLEQFAHLATNAVVGANVLVGKGVHIGSNATIREKVCIGDFSLIGAGAVVLNDVPENSIVAGNPAKIIKYRNN